MTIRPANPNDFAAILEIYAAAKLDELRYEEARFELLPLDRDEKRLAELRESEIYLCELVGIVGYCARFGSEIRALFVHPASRGKGIGKRLLEFLLALIAGPAQLCVARSNLPAKNLYMKYGFIIVEEFEASYNGIPVLANRMVRQDRK